MGFTVKQNPDCTIDKLKTRLVIKGYAQMYEIDYFETLSPVAKLNSTRVVISLSLGGNVGNVFQSSH